MYPVGSPELFRHVFKHRLKRIPNLQHSAIDLTGFASTALGRKYWHCTNSHLDLLFAVEQTYLCFLYPRFWQSFIAITGTYCTLHNTRACCWQVISHNKSSIHGLPKLFSGHKPYCKYVRHTCRSVPSGRLIANIVSHHFWRFACSPWDPRDELPSQLALLCWNDSLHDDTGHCWSGATCIDSIQNLSHHLRFFTKIFCRKRRCLDEHSDSETRISRFCYHLRYASQNCSQLYRISVFHQPPFGFRQENTQWVHSEPGPSIQWFLYCIFAEVHRPNCASRFPRAEKYKECITSDCNLDCESSRMPMHFFKSSKARSNLSPFFSSSVSIFSSSVYRAVQSIT